MRSRNYDKSVNNIFNKQKSAPVASMNSHFSSKSKTMKQNIEAQLLHTIHNLEAALNVCHNVDSTSDDDDRTYAYATGYSKSAMTTSVEDLEKILHYLRSQVSWTILGKLSLFMLLSALSLPSF